jgi:GxxExxY protein
MELNDLSHEIINAAINVHKELGPGLFESVYKMCMIVEFVHKKIPYQSEVPIPVSYKGVKVNDEAFRLDLLIDDRVIVELKSVEHVSPVHKKQLLTYLRLTNKSLGLLINFNEAKLIDGVTRIVNGL